MKKTNIQEGPVVTATTDIVFLEKGTCRFSISMRSHTVSAPCVIIIFPEQVCEVLDPSADMSAKVISVSGRIFDEMFRISGSNYSLFLSLRDMPVMNISREEKDAVDNYCRMLADIAGRTSAGSCILTSAVHLIISMLFVCSKGNSRRDIPVYESRQKEIFSAFQDHLSLHYRTHRDIPFYAQKLGITPKYLSQVVKQMSNRTVLDIIDEYVITDTKSLLSSSRLSLTGISDLLHFPSRSVFGKYFKRVTGTTLSAYRKTNKKKP